ncbi:MAG TPA: hypothetical protein PK034_04780 [Rugosibacter sp.]|nr:hypothetical protein [Rugosibacter sp.]
MIPSSLMPARSFIRCPFQQVRRATLGCTLPAAKSVRRAALAAFQRLDRLAFWAEKPVLAGD